MAVAALAWTFRDTQPARVADLLVHAGGAVVLVAVPQGLSLWVESLGWRMAFESMGHRLPRLGLFRARLATEALAQTLPLGVVFCESMKPLLLARTCGADLPTSLAGMAARKWLLIASQSVYVAGFAWLAWPVLSSISRAVLGSSALPHLLIGAAWLLALLALLGYVFLAHGRVAARLHTHLSRVPSAWLRGRLAPLRSRFAHADWQLHAFFRTAFHSPLPLVMFLLGWVLESADTFLILYLLGVRLPWTTVGALEVASSFLRNVAFMVPAGLGVQDLSYLTFLRALGVPDALNLTAAFLLLKRCKEFFWALCGYAVLAWDLRPTPTPKPVEQTC